VGNEDQEHELRALAAHLVGPAEIASILKIEANTINAWKKRYPDFPAPVRRLKTGDVWDDREVLAWAKKTGRYDPSETASDSAGGSAPLCDPSP
jgi:hypothetical protein